MVAIAEHMANLPECLLYPGQAGVSLCHLATPLLVQTQGEGGAQAWQCLVQPGLQQQQLPGPNMCHLHLQL
jgi:hypothetical protein